MKVDDRLVNACKDFINKRFPNSQEIEGAAAIYTEDGEIIISTAPEVFNSGAGLCHETGAICDAYKLDKKIVASVCVSKEKDGSYVILTPCGICQERLYHWGGDVELVCQEIMIFLNMNRKSSKRCNLIIGRNHLLIK